MLTAGQCIALVDGRAQCLMLVLCERRRAALDGHPRLPPELLEPLAHAFIQPYASLHRLCREGRLHALQQWDATFGVHLPPTGIPSSLRYEPIASDLRALIMRQFMAQTPMWAPYEAVWAACVGGHVDVARWLARTFPLQLEHLGSCVLNVCTHGQLEAARWLCEELGVTMERERAYLALENACRKGHVDIARWLHETQGLDAVGPTRSSDRVHIGKAFNETCEAGHMHVAQWLHTTYQLTPVDMANGRMGMFGAMNALEAACEREHMDMVRWLHGTFSWSLTDLRQALHKALFQKCEAVVKYLMVQGGLTADDISAVDGWELTRWRAPGLHDWLMQVYGVPLS